MIDYTNIIKRNLIVLMEKYQKTAENDSEAMYKKKLYRSSLLKLPCHPILSKDDIYNIKEGTILQEIYKIIDNNDDLHEVIEFLKIS